MYDSIRLAGGFVLLVCVATVGNACQQREGERTEASEVELATADIGAALRTLDAAIVELDGHIGTLEREIRRLESETASKAAQIDALVSNIEARKREVAEQIERDRQNALILCAFGFCNVAAVSLVSAYENDARLQQLERELSSARQDRESAHAAVAAYRNEKNNLQPHLDSLRARETTLRTLLVSSDDAPTDFLRLAKRADRMTELRSNLDLQARSLGEVKELATSLAATVDGALVSVAKASANVERLAEAARKQALGLLEILTSGDPNANAEKWLETWIADKTKQLLREAGWDAKRFVDHLIQRTFPGDASSPAAEALKARLVAALDPLG